MTIALCRRVFFVDVFFGFVHVVGCVIFFVFEFEFESESESENGHEGGFGYWLG